MIPELIPHYFNPEELAHLKAIEGKRLAKVLYTIWRNVAKAQETYEALDWISIYFEDGHRLDLTIREDQQGMEIRSLNYGLEQSKVVQQFAGQVELKQQDMSNSPIWTQALGQNLESVGLVSPFDGYFQSNVLQLDFGGQGVEITLGQEGLIAYTI